MIIGDELLEVESVEVVQHLQLIIAFSNGQKKTVDLTALLQSPPPVFAPLQHEDEFKQVSVNIVGGIQWACGADLSAEYLFAA